MQTREKKLKKIKIKIYKQQKVNDLSYQFIFS